MTDADLQLPQSPVRAHYVKAAVKVRQYPDGTLAVFHGPRRIARYSVAGDSRSPRSRPPQRDAVLAAVKAWPGMRGACRSCAATASLDRGCARRHCERTQVGTKKRPFGRTKKLTRNRREKHRASHRLIQNHAGASTASKPVASITTRSGQMMCYENRTT